MTRFKASRDCLFSLGRHDRTWRRNSRHAPSSPHLRLTEYVQTQEDNVVSSERSLDPSCMKNRTRG